MEWYYAVDNEQIGPIDEGLFKDLINKGTITESTLVWNQGMEDWKTLHDSGYTIPVNNQSPPETPLQHESYPEVVESKVEVNPNEVVEYNLEFTGSAMEYFKIWIVNMFFTIITLGIYAAWAKVRNRQYLYSNTTLAGDTFDFLGNPVAIFKGNLIIAAVFGLSTLIKHYSPKYAFAATLLFYIVLPFLVYKSMQFLARNSAWRNLRFSFSGKLKESYYIFFLLPLLLLISWGVVGYIVVGNPFRNGNPVGMIGNIVALYILIFLSAYIIGIYILFRVKKYFFANMSYGHGLNTFSVTPGRFYSTYTIAGGLYLGGGLIISAILGILAASAANSTINIFPIMAILYLPLICILLSIKMYIYARINNYCWSELMIENLTFKSTLKFMPMAGIMVTNMLAIILSLGLMIPWAKIRMTKYKLDNLKIYSNDSFENFAAATTSEVSALGDAAMDAFDLDISL
jgi:uncharacterized membrane protein YjgN (DUF898 family)